MTMTPRKTLEPETKAAKLQPALPLNDALERIREARAALDRFIPERGRCARAAMAGDTNLEELEHLHAEREEAIATAFADDVQPAIADIEERIAEHEAGRAELMRQRDIARAACQVLDRRIADVQALLNEQIESARELALQMLAPEFDAAEKAFGQ